MFTHPEYDGHEAVLHAHDAATGLKAIVALHNTRLGPSFGGCRMYPYADPAQALTDALRLSRGMTYKAAICELPYGGGKSVVLADPRRDKTPELLRAMGRVIEGQGGRGGGDLRSAGRCADALRARCRAQRPDHPTAARPVGLRRCEQPAGGDAP